MINFENFFRHSFSRMSQNNFFAEETFTDILYCKKISRHENFTVCRPRPKNREIKMPRRKINFELKREIIMQ